MSCIVLSEYELDIFYIFDFILNIINQIKVSREFFKEMHFLVLQIKNGGPKLASSIQQIKCIFLGNTLLNKDLVPVGSIQPVVQIPNDTGNFCLQSSYISIQ